MLVSCRRSAPPGKLAAQWQAAGMAEARPARMREMIQVGHASTPDMVNDLLQKHDAAIAGFLIGIDCRAGITGSSGRKSTGRVRGRPGRSNLHYWLHARRGRSPMCQSDVANRPNSVVSVGIMHPIEGVQLYGSHTC